MIRKYISAFHEFLALIELPSIGANMLLIATIIIANIAPMHA